MKNVLIILLFTNLLMYLTSCSSTKQAQYLQGVFDTARLSQLNLQEPLVQKGDLLGIVVYSESPAATAIYNQPVISPNVAIGGINSGGLPSQGYLVDSDGNIQFQSIGSIHVAGMNRKQLNDTLVERLKVFLVDPYTSIRFLNYKITVIGEVTRPGTYSIPGERVNVLEAIGLSGELTLYGRKDDVLVIREANNRREFGRLDLRDPNVFTSPYYYLQQNDVVVIDQVKNKSSANDQVVLRNVSIGATVVSTIAILISVLRLN